MFKRSMKLDSCLVLLTSHERDKSWLLSSISMNITMGISRGVLDIDIFSEMEIRKMLNC